jgi:hypothetical protein
MKRSTFGALVASTLVGLVGGTAALAQSGKAEAKACYRTHCGKSIAGHEGKCGGTRVEDLRDEASCSQAGGAWTTEADAAKYKKKK